MAAPRDRDRSEDPPTDDDEDRALQHALAYGTKAVAVSSNKALTSKFRGVCWNKKNKRWQAAINSSGKYLYLGSYDTEEEAARIFDKAAIRIRGAKARLNFRHKDYVDANNNLIPDAHIESLLQEANNPEKPKRQRSKPAGPLGDSSPTRAAGAAVGAGRGGEASGATGTRPSANGGVAQQQGSARPNPQQRPPAPRLTLMPPDLPDDRSALPAGPSGKDLPSGRAVAQAQAPGLGGQRLPGSPRLSNGSGSAFTALQQSSLLHLLQGQTGGEYAQLGNTQDFLSNPGVLGGSLGFRHSSDGLLGGGAGHMQPTPGTATLSKPDLFATISSHLPDGGMLDSLIPCEASDVIGVLFKTPGSDRTSAGIFNGRVLRNLGQFDTDRMAKQTCLSVLELMRDLGAAQSGDMLGGGSSISLSGRPSLGLGTSLNLKHPSSGIAGGAGGSGIGGLGGSGYGGSGLGGVQLPPAPLALQSATGLGLNSLNGISHLDLLQAAAAAPGGLRGDILGTTNSLGSLSSLGGSLGGLNGGLGNLGNGLGGLGGSLSLNGSLNNSLSGLGGGLGLQAGSGGYKLVMQPPLGMDNLVAIINPSSDTYSLDNSAATNIGYKLEPILLPRWQIAATQPDPAPGEASRNSTITQEATDESGNGGERPGALSKRHIVDLEPEGPHKRRKAASLEFAAMQQLSNIDVQEALQLIFSQAAQR